MAGEPTVRDAFVADDDSYTAWMTPSELAKYADDRSYRDSPGGQVKVREIGADIVAAGYCPDRHGGMSGDTHSWPPSFPITLVLEDTRTYLWDGNHRVAGMVGDGYTESVPVRVTDLRTNRTAPPVPAMSRIEPLRTTSPGLVNPLGGHEWFHGTPASPDDLKDGFWDPMHLGDEPYEAPDEQPSGTWNKYLGTHFAAHHDIADSFANGTYQEVGHGGVVHARLGLRNPKIYQSEFDLDSDAYEFAYAREDHPQNHLTDLLEDGQDGVDGLEECWGTTYGLIKQYGTAKIPPGTVPPETIGESGEGWPTRKIWMDTHPGRWSIAEAFREHLISQGYDGVIYGNEHERDGRRGVEGVCAVVFDPANITLTRQHHYDQEPCDWTPGPVSSWEAPWNVAAPVEALREHMAAAAQQVYDRWDAGEDGDPTIGFGGICDQIADALAGVISEHIPNVQIRDGGFDGDDHAYLIVSISGQDVLVDIPPYVYETGGGYTWEKIPDVQFTPDDIAIGNLGPTPPEELDDYGYDNYESDSADSDGRPPASAEFPTGELSGDSKYDAAVASLAAFATAGDAFTDAVGLLEAELTGVGFDRDRTLMGYIAALREAADRVTSVSTAATATLTGNHQAGADYHQAGASADREAFCNA